MLAVTDLRQTLRASDGSSLEVIRDLSFSLAKGEFLSVVGPSGAGKTTLLRVISGLIDVTGGRVTHRGEVVKGVPALLSIVFQEYNKTLFPWLSVQKNVTLGLRSLPKREAQARATEALQLMGLDDFAARYPWELSGGMQQRVALARAVAGRPELLLMDEPFASVDALTRMQLEDTVQDLWRQAGFSALLVTHDVGEAVYLGDRVLVLSARPSTVIDEVVVDLSRPRTQKTTKAKPRYQELVNHILTRIEHTGSSRVREPNSMPGAAGGDDS